MLMKTVEELGCADLDTNEIVFPNLGIDIHVDPTAFTIFGIDVQWYGICIVIGLLLALVFAYRNMRRVGVHPDRATDVIIGGILGALVGARLYYVLLRWDDYKGNPLSILNTREGGLAIFGGLIGAVLVGFIVSRFRKVAALPMLDLCGVGFLIGQGIGRWGNFFNQEAFGVNTDGLFAMTGGRVQQWIKSNYSALGSYNTDVTVSADYPVHPCFLYESAWCLLGAVLLYIVFRKFRKFDGQIILMYMFWYGLERAVVEGLRTDSLMIGQLRVSQALAAVICVTSAVLLLVFFFKVKRMGRDYVLYVDSKASKKLMEETDRQLMAAETKKPARKAKPEKDEPAPPIIPDEDEAEHTDTKDET